MICGGKNTTNGYHLAIFIVDVAFAHHFNATHLPSPSHPTKMLVVLATLVKTT